MAGRARTPGPSPHYCTCTCSRADVLHFLCRSPARHLPSTRTSPLHPHSPCPASLHPGLPIEYLRFYRSGGYDFGTGGCPTRCPFQQRCVLAAPRVLTGGAHAVVERQRWWGPVKRGRAGAALVSFHSRIVPFWCPCLPQRTLMALAAGGMLEGLASATQASRAAPRHERRRLAAQLVAGAPWLQPVTSAQKSCVCAHRRRASGAPCYVALPHLSAHSCFVTLAPSSPVGAPPSPLLPAVTGALPHPSLMDGGAVS